jgi:hypothetical protein
MAKSCHDVDWIRYIIGATCTRVTSFGSLSYFTKENKPTEAGDAKRCLDCPLMDTCAYSSKKIYLDAVKRVSAFKKLVSYHFRVSKGGQFTLYAILNQMLKVLQMP